MKFQIEIDDGPNQSHKASQRPTRQDTGKPLGNNVLLLVHILYKN